jgi:hypothetical protein
MGGQARRSGTAGAPTHGGVGSLAVTLVLIALLTVGGYIVWARWLAPPDSATVSLPKVVNRDATDRYMDGPGRRLEAFLVDLEPRIGRGLMPACLCGA